MTTVSVLFTPVLMSTVFSVICLVNAPLYAGEHKTITDMCGKKVEVPVSPERIACMHCVSPEKIMTLGKGNLISLMAEQSPWAYKLYPEIKNAQTSKGITPEQMLDMKIDFVLYTPGMTKEEQYSSAGLKTVCAFSADKRPTSLNEFVKNFKGQITLFGELLGPDAKARADNYNRYFDKKVKQILSITSKIDKKNKPAVYYGGLHSNMLNSQGKGSVMQWNTEVSGGNYLPQALDDNHAKATIQQVLSWEPDIILLSGYCDSLDIVTKNPDWASMKAVKNGKVYRIPRGIYTWDHASGEGVLLMIYMAKIFHPELFKDWNMIKEMKAFYSEVYGKTVTDQDAERILQNLPPR
ncbi:MAG: putative ABC transporter substrate-binding lipoprotein YhfQ precursor [Syntrophorhabdaceae bacterium PtaU1.Bin034]|nr:MAG: putative ABC transporter substrate-binding lipoprotein YhfQ precursor [Syntrophorhabdaceae bacterium PtaU1.Bin034]